MIPPNWKFKEIIRNGKPELILEYCIIGTCFRQYTFRASKEFEIGDVLINKKNKSTGIVSEIHDNKIIIKKKRFEITIEMDELNDWYKN